MQCFSRLPASVLPLLQCPNFDAVEFEVTSIDVRGVVREYRSLRACAEEIGMSRLYGGIHYRFSNEDGLALGRKVARAVVGSFPAGALPTRGR